IYKMYGALIAIEREALNDPDAAARDALIDRVDAIENSVNQMKMPLAYADQFYVLREHIGFVRHRLELARDAAMDTTTTGSSDSGDDHHAGEQTREPHADSVQRTT